MPWKRRDYPADWETVRAAVLERARNRCEWRYDDGTRCEARNGVAYHRGLQDADLLFECYVQERDDMCTGRDVHELAVFPVQETPICVVLTTAHTCDCDPKCGDLSHLLSLCQMHHLRMDAKQHARNAARTRLQRRIDAGQPALFME